MGDDTVMINRAPVLTLWAAICAERQGFDPDAALTLGKVLAGLNAQAKGRMIGLYGEPKEPSARGHEPSKVGLGEDFWVRVCGRSVPAKNTEDGIRGVVKDQPIDPAAVRRYIEGKFGDDLPRVREAMTGLAAAYDPDDLADVAYDLYEEFRPPIERGKRGWGQKGPLDLALLRRLAEQAPRR